MKKNKIIKRALFGALIILIGITLWLYTSERKDKEAKLTDNNLVSATEEKLELLKQYIDASYHGEINNEDLQDGIYKGFIEGLNDPYSVYYTKEETKLLKEQTTGEYSGIGAVLSQDKETGIITILQVYKGSPAQESGLKEGDYFLKIGDRELTAVDDLSEVVTYIKGAEGSKVELTVYRKKEEKEFNITVTRRKIEVQTVDARILEDTTGYISISEFDTVTLEQYKSALKDLEDQGMDRLIVDLRNNPGGNLNTVADMLDLMLPKGLSVYMEDKTGSRRDFESDEEHQFKKPLVVLVNENSASASEIYAGAIQDYKLGTIMGTQTYGKGVVQQIFDLSDGTSVKLTIAEYFTPNGRNINSIGITPDKVVEYQENENDVDADNQLREAIDYIKGK